jgi:hypothetical protein
MFHRVIQGAFLPCPRLLSVDPRGELQCPVTTSGLPTGRDPPLPRPLRLRLLGLDA